MYRVLFFLKYILYILIFKAINILFKKLKRVRLMMIRDYKQVLDLLS